MAGLLRDFFSIATTCRQSRDGERKRSVRAANLETLHLCLRSCMRTIRKPPGKKSFPAWHVRTPLDNKFKESKNENPQGNIWSAKTRYHD
jgi:hypothetical protein